MSDAHPRDAKKENGPRKRDYISPVLVCYGRVSDLTQNGAGTQIESTKSFFGIPYCEFNSKERSCKSDRRAKENIVRIGTHPLGIGLYLFDYKPEFRDQCGHGHQFGVMAQEVEVVMPEAVCVHPDGYKAVDYGMLGISRPSH
jgi:hypothetical protein